MGAHAKLLAPVQRTQVRPATNEEAEGIETVTSLLPDLTEAVREGRARHCADITEEDEDDDPKQQEIVVTMSFPLCRRRDKGRRSVSVRIFMTFGNQKRSERIGDPGSGNPQRG